MSEAKFDVTRAIDAAKVIIAGRDPVNDLGAVMVTLEHTVAAVLLVVMNNNPVLAAGMLNEGLVRGVEERLSTYAANAAKTEKTP